MSEHSKVAVIGAGAIGGWVAAKLAIAGTPVMAMTKRGALDQIEIVEQGEARTIGLASFDGPVDLLVVAVKATALAEAAQSAKSLIDQRTLVVPMLNGVPWWFVEGMQLSSVDPDRRIADALPIAQVVGCVVHASCSRSDSGAVIVKHADKLIIGEISGEHSRRLASLSGLLHRAGLCPDMTGNVRRAIWYKLWGNATTNPMSALVRATTDRLHSDPECRSWLLEGMAELSRVGAAIGCPITESGEERIEVAFRLGAFKTSMLQDVEAGRPIELEALLGAPREIARAFAIATPALDRLYGVTRLMAESLGLI